MNSRKRIFLFAVCMLSAIICMSSFMYADSSYESCAIYEITSTYKPGIALHPYPDRESEVLLRIPYREQFSVLAVIGSYGFTYYNDTPGWINLDYAGFVAAEAFPDGRPDEDYISDAYYTITSTYAKGIALHPEPEKTSAVLTRLPHETEFYVEAVIYNYGYTYYDGYEGWINLDYAEMTSGGDGVEWNTDGASADGDVFLTEDEAYQSVYNYIDQTLDIYTVYNYHGYVVIGEATQTDYVILVRSYTGARAQYYVDKYTGAVYEQWLSPVTNEWDPLTYVYTITEEELININTKEYEYITGDGIYYYSMLSITNGKANVENDVITGCASEYDCDQNTFTIYGTTNKFRRLTFPLDFSRETVLEDKYRVFSYDEDTEFRSSGGDGPMDYYTAQEFVDYAWLCKDTNLSLIIEMQGGIAKTVTIAS